MSEDYFVVNNPGQLPTGYGRKSSSFRFYGGTLYNNAATGIIWVEDQVYIGASETVLRKERFEKFLWDQTSVDISHMHCDNGIFASDQFHLECNNKHQDQYFSGFG